MSAFNLTIDPEHLIVTFGQPASVLPKESIRVPFEIRDGSFRRRINPTLLYRSTTFSRDAAIFADLLAYAPGLNTSRADIQGVLRPGGAVARTGAAAACQAG